METAHKIYGVNGRLFKTKVAQKWVSNRRAYDGGWLKVEIQFDDECRNGHASFAITGDWVHELGRRHGEMGGCIHHLIEAGFPEFAKLIKWHLSSTDGPMHYIANTVYHAGDMDYNGLRKGERRQIRNGRNGLPSWQLKPTVDGVVVETPTQYLDSATAPPVTNIKLEYVPWESVGEGKARELEAARNAAVWPEATDEQLCLPKQELTLLLEARLPKLLDEFKDAIESIGFDWGIQPRNKTV